MQDRFKFRVFISDKKNSKNSLTGMFKVHRLHTGTNKAIITSLYGNCSIKLENNILMQCTGLKDKNGKLIYEGDIVSVKVETQDFFGEDEYYSENYKGEIIFEKGEIAIDVIDTTKYPISLYYHAKDCEVIGNIYENPELLKEVNDGL